MNSIESGNIIKVYLWLFVMMTVYSCGNATVSSKINNDRKELYIQIAFEDFFDSDLLDLYIDDKLILQNDTLKSGFSDGLTNTILNVFKSKNGYIIDVHGYFTEYVPKSNEIMVSVVLNGNKTEYRIDQNEGQYIGFNKKKDGSLEFRQNKQKPIYD